MLPLLCGSDRKSKSWMIWRVRKEVGWKFAVHYWHCTVRVPRHGSSSRRRGLLHRMATGQGDNPTSGQNSRCSSANLVAQKNANPSILVSLSVDESICTAATRQVHIPNLSPSGLHPYARGTTDSSQHSSRVQILTCSPASWFLSPPALPFSPRGP